MDHKHIRLPLRDLIELRSRPAEANEPWFPTQTGDWVVLDGSKLLRVVSQSAQSVVLVEKGGARRTYTTPAFLELAPRSISGGFRILVTFGVDYSHQPQVTGEILETLKQKIVSGMSARGCDAESFKAMVEFKEASASSLDIAVIVDFKGEHAESYDQLYRFLNSLCVDCCNENHWIIPFQQLTVHTHQNNFPAPLTPISEDLPSHP